ncbi:MULTISPECIES: glycosyltransferase family 25 protein [unclassified Yoonia]|uniref:glycosyltransferase family 25 protein n=1 Tax=unclassified Yoonia TaxID=2629118 RepID=UPI002B002BF7|nr:MULTISPECIES: glycosyltransferase family 25 protein [unclassified Yoonia]
MFTQVINLDRSADRLAAISRDLQLCLPEWQRLPAIEPDADYVTTLPIYHRAKARKYFGRDLRRGEVGCFQSHRAALMALVQSGADHGLVLEDDVILTRPAVDAIIAAVALLDARDPDWACVNLVHAQVLRRRHFAAIGGHDLWRSYQFPLLTSALLWRRDKAVAFLEWTATTGIYAPVDNQLRDWISLGNKGYAFDPPPVGLRAFDSTIQVAEQASTVPAHSNKFTIHEIRQKLPLYWRSYRDHLLHR